MPKATRIVFEYETEPDFSWLEQSHYQPGSPDYEPVYRTRADMRAKRNPIEDYANPDKHVALCMLVYRECPDCGEEKLVDSLGNIDFLQDSDDWTTGSFRSLREMRHLPRGSYLRALAREAGLPRR